MRNMLLGFVIGVVVAATSVFAQQLDPSDIDFTPMPRVLFGVTPGPNAPVGIDYRPVIGLREGMTPPQNATLIGHIDATGATGGKNSKVRIQFWQIGQ